MKKTIMVFLLALCMVVMMFPMTSLATNDYTVGDSFKYAVAGNIDDLPRPTVDPDLANSLNTYMYGYWEKTFTLDGVPRTAKIYLSQGIPIRSYFTVIAIPDGVDTEEFLWKAGWIDMAEKRQEGLFVLEPGPGGWGSYDEELPYVNAAMTYYAGTGNSYFSIFGENYFVGYGAGAPVLEAWAVANPVKVISQVYFDSPGLPQEYIDSYASIEYGGENPGYVTFTFPPGFQKITKSETVLPTWYINPQASAADSIAYWKASNDCVAKGVKDTSLGMVYKQADPSDRWQTSYMGSISKVAVLDHPVSYWNKNTQGDIQNFMYYYSRYENYNGYANQLVIRANYEQLGIELHTMYVNGRNREYMIYVPGTAKAIWGDKIPVMWVWAGNSQTDRVFIDATSWWYVAQKEGFMLVIPCERINSNAISVSHGDNDAFFAQLKDVLINNYPVDPTRYYTTGQSAGSGLSQSWGRTHPEYYAAIASTSGTGSGSAVNKMIPNYMIVGAGDNSGVYGNLWGPHGSSLTSWATYWLGVDGFVLGDGSNGVVSGWHGRFTTWTWSKEFGGVSVPLFQTTTNAYRNHNCIQEEMPLLWAFAEHYSSVTNADGSVTRYYSPSAFKVPYDQVQIYP